MLAYNIEKGMFMYKKYIENWEVPPKLVESFPNHEFIYRTEGECSYYDNTHSLNAKETLTFELFDKTKNQAVIFIDCLLYDKNTRYIQASNIEPFVTLKVIHIPFENYRRKGVAKYYINKVIEMSKQFEIYLLKVNAYSKDKMFKISKNLKNCSEIELAHFYKSFETDDFKVKVSYMNGRIYEKL